MRWLPVIGLALLAASSLAVAPSFADAQASAAGDDPLLPLARKVFDLGNRERRLHGVPPLRWNDALAAPARRHSDSMMERGFFSHVDPVRGGLARRLNAAGVRWTRCGENIFRESGMDDPAEEAVKGWMKSPAHRSSLLDPRFSETGVGIAISPSTEYYITQDFIRR